tara:strand:+ start:1065 stop:1223 length:159 start_codon:yes stop_codon:yes gene_type:complete
VTSLRLKLNELLSEQALQVKELEVPEVSIPMSLIIGTPLFYNRIFINNETNY